MNDLVKSDQQELKSAGLRFLTLSSIISVKYAYLRIEDEPVINDACAMRVKTRAHKFDPNFILIG